MRTAANSVATAVVIGAGFIGCEASVSLARRGILVTTVLPGALPQESRLGTAAGELLAGWLAAEAVELLPERRLIGIDEGRRVILDSGPALDTDLVLLATGMRPDNDLADKAGIRTDDGRVRTDQRLRTSAPDVFAAGDVALAYNPSAGRALAVEHWGEAITMGDVAGRNAAGGDASWDNVPGFWSVIGDRTLKYAAWGDGFEHADAVHHVDGGVTVWYTDRGNVVGVLTHNADDDYDRGTRLVERHSPAADMN